MFPLHAASFAMGIKKVRSIRLQHLFGKFSSQGFVQSLFRSVLLQAVVTFRPNFILERVITIRLSSIRCNVRDCVGRGRGAIRNKVVDETRLPFIHQHQSCSQGPHWSTGRGKNVGRSRNFFLPFHSRTYQINLCPEEVFGNSAPTGQLPFLFKSSGLLVGNP